MEQTVHEASGNSRLPVVIAMVVAALAAIIYVVASWGANRVGGVQGPRTLDARDRTEMRLKAVDKYSRTGFYFDPSTVLLRAGKSYRLFYTNKSGIPHDFLIEKMPAKLAAAGEPAGSDHGGQATDHGGQAADHGGHDNLVHAIAETGQTMEVDFTPTEPGTYRLICSLPGHAESGMVSTVNVE